MFLLALGPGADTLWLQFACDIAWGMRHLHTCFDTPVLHRDLSTRNLLVTDDNHILVADFGMSKFECMYCLYCIVVTATAARVRMDIQDAAESGMYMHTLTYHIDTSVRS